MSALLKTSARPLGWAYIALVVYASLYPFIGWRDQGIAPWAFVFASWPNYWGRFDVVANLLGYVPLGFLLALARLRGQSQPRAVAPAVFICIAISLFMEAVQTYLPNRVPSNLDWALNSLGGVIGVCLAWGLERFGLLAHWSDWRRRWFVPEAHGALALLALWPVALLFPAAVPFGLGQVFERLEQGLAEWLQGTAWASLMPLRALELQPLTLAAEIACVALGALIPCLLVYSVMRSITQRLVLAALALLLGLSTTALSAALSWGPTWAWGWITPSVAVALIVATTAVLPLALLPRRACLALLLLALVWQLSLVNPAATSAYFAHTLQTWEQGRFIRFHGVVQWLAWVWPYLCLAYALRRLSRA